MALKKCASCGAPFLPRAQSPGQLFCSAPACQCERRRRWQLEKRRTDADYRLNDRAAAAAWRLAHPDYWRGHQRLSKAGAIPGGLYRLTVLAAPDGNEDVWLVRLTPGKPRQASPRRAK
jgi:hypothetical protein